MSWDCRTVQINISVRVHDEAGINQEQLCNEVAWRATGAVEGYLESLQPALPDGVEVVMG